MDGDYYNWTMSGRISLQGLPVVRPEHLIPLKARAWLDLTDRRASGHHVDSRDLRKHRNDVFRLYAVLDPDYPMSPPGAISQDMAHFIQCMRSEAIDLKSLGLATMSQAAALAALTRTYVSDLA